MAAPHRERLGQAVGLVLFGLLVLRQFSMFPGFDGPAEPALRWALVTAFFVLACSAYATRRAAKVLARGPLDVALPLVCSALPLIQVDVSADFIQAVARVLSPLGVTDHDLWLPVSRAFVTAGLAIALAGEAVMVAGLYRLRRSFSIFTEARELVTSGLYRFTRHPLYLGELLAVWGIFLSWPNAWSVGVASLFTVLQLWRARREEALLAETFPEYADYRARVGMFWPKRL